MQEFIQLEPSGASVSFNESNLFDQHYQLNNRIDEDYFYLHTFALIYAIETGRNCILFGNEFERNAFEIAECWLEGETPKDVALYSTVPIYRFDYDQSLTMAMKFNIFFKAWDIDLRFGTLLGNCNEVQVQYLLQKLNPKLVQFQYSCWNATKEKRWCGECPKCAWILMLWDLLGIKALDHHLTQEERKQAYEAYALELGPNNYLCSMHHLLQEVTVQKDLFACYQPMQFRSVDGFNQNYRIPTVLHALIQSQLLTLKDLKYENGFSS